MRNPVFGKFIVFSSSLLFFILHLPFVFATNKPIPEVKPVLLKMEYSMPTGLIATKSKPTKPESIVYNLYDSLNLNLIGLSKNVYDMAITGFNYLLETGKISNSRFISIVDFSQPSCKKRLFVIDLINAKVVFNTYVAHGVNSGKETANVFSNRPGSNQSSLGFYETSNTYIGGNGYSLRLEGLEPGINDNANRRAIVMHGADYVNENLIHSQGYMGRSFGCPSVPEKMSKPIIDKIKNGSCLFIYSPDKNYLRRSRIMHTAG